MNKLVLRSLILVFIILFLIPIGPSFDFDRNQSFGARVLGIDYDYIYCQSSGHIEDRQILCPDFSKIKGKKGTLGDFEVNYTGFTEEARLAFQYAVDIWDMLLDSDAKIVVDANFIDLNSGVLGSAAPSAMYVNFSDKVDKNIEYAAPLADKIAGYSINGIAADLSCNFNESANWYYDFNQPDLIGESQSDFVSVVLHELGHGLGFLSRHAFASPEGIGFISGQAPALTDIFSLLLEEGNTTNLVLNYDEGSNSLGGALTSEDLYLNPHTFSTEERPYIYAPMDWDRGSSLSHLDELTYNESDPLMTPFIGAMEIIHDPQIALRMMEDMGWSSSFIAHRSAHVELVNQSIPIEVLVTSDPGVGFDSSRVILVYSQDSFRLSQDTLDMTTNDNLTFNSELPQNNETGRYQYYVALDDTTNLGYSSPLLAPQLYHDIQIGIDSDPPSVDHIAIEFFFINEGLPVFSAVVDDSFTGVDSVTIEYALNGGEVITIGMTPKADNEYEQILDLDIPSLREGDTITYRLKAIDNASSTNVAYAPEQGFYSIAVRGIPLIAEYYSTGFDNANIDFVFNGFSIRSDSGFDGVGLHSDHPYANAGTGNEIHLTAQLRIPIRVIDNGRIEFDEVVLVEPGADNSVFGDNRFWDYVIVEVSENSGVEWTPIVNGYDSSNDTRWKTRYDTGIVGQNSTSNGDKGLIQRRSIPLHQPNLGIDIGDVVLLRFRLFSDAFATGWGWLIDDLEVQEEQNTTSITYLESNDKLVDIFPNPIVGVELNYRIESEESVERIQISDVNGRILLNMSNLNRVGDNGQVDVSTIPTGVYFATFYINDIAITKRFLKL